FEEMCRWVEETRFERLGVFTYSHEENTHAYALVDDVPQEEKHRRANAIMAIQQNISAELNQEKMSRIYKVLIDKKEGDYFYGRTEFDSPEVDNEVLISAKENYLRIGDYVTVKIIDSEHFDLYAEVIK